MTRKRVKRGLEGVLKENCPYCSGEGKILSFSNFGNKAKQKIVHYSKNFNGNVCKVKFIVNYEGKIIRIYRKI